MLTGMNLSARPATGQDYARFVHLYAELAIPDPVPDEATFASAIAPRALFLREAGRAVAYAYWQEYGTLLHVRHVAVDPGARRRGVGRTLMAQVAERARALGCHHWYLNVKPENAAARRLYASVGLTERTMTVAMDVDWRSVGALPEGGRGDVRAVSPHDDALLEADLGLPTGQVGTLRGLQQVLLFTLMDGGRHAGFAAFDPTFPGSNPFRARSAAHVRLLLKAMEPHALPEHDRVRIVIENHAHLVDALTAAGARPVMTALRMEGMIPRR
jgi:GNAT superfamily N-acetyltransferase